MGKNTFSTHLAEYLTKYTHTEDISVTLVDNNKCSETYEDFISGGKVCGKSQNNTGACLVKFYVNRSILITYLFFSLMRVGLCHTKRVMRVVVNNNISLLEL